MHDDGMAGPQDRTPERVLVIDDDESTRVLVAEMVRAAGHEVYTAPDAAHARRDIDGRERERRPFALVVCDLNMPGESGADLLRWIRARHPDVAVVMATGTSDPEIADELLTEGAYGYVLKPFRRNELAINVANALLRRRLERENRAYREQLEQRVASRTAELRRAVERLEVAREQTIRRLSLAIEFRNPETGEHVERIGQTAETLARGLGLDDGRCTMIRTAAALHDVGKIGVPDTILLKPGPLNPEERERIEQHAEIGYRMLAGSGSDLLELAAHIAWTHHERFDGRGYPRALAGDEITLEGRITAVADVFDALIHDRVYRPALPLDDALEIMRRGRGSQFDPDVLDVFTSELERLLPAPAGPR